MPKDLLFPLRKLHGNLYENRQAKIAANTLSKRIRGVDAGTVFLVMTPEHGNLGDHLICGCSAYACGRLKPGAMPHM